ncbi:MAG: hypothetical protein ACHP7I_05515 [Terriglobales bacterium]
MTTTATTASLALAEVGNFGVASVSVELGFMIALVSMEPMLAVLRRKKEITWVPEPRCSSPLGAWYNKVAMGHLPVSRAGTRSITFP